MVLGTVQRCVVNPGLRAAWSSPYICSVNGLRVNPCFIFDFTEIPYVRRRHVMHQIQTRSHSRIHILRPHINERHGSPRGPFIANPYNTA